MYERKIFEDLDGPICSQLRARLGELSEYLDAVPTVSTQLKSEPFPEAQVWITNVGGASTGFAQQDLSYQVRVIGKDRKATRELAHTARSILDSYDYMRYDLDNITPSSPIYTSVSQMDTTTPAPTTLYESAGVTTYYFTLRLHQVARTPTA